jgi:hypothetical protein
VASAQHAVFQYIFSSRIVFGDCFVYAKNYAQKIAMAAILLTAPMEPFDDHLNGPLHDRFNVASP